MLEMLQFKVQQKLGRCMMRLQQYELLLKVMLVSMSVEGRAAAIETSANRRASVIQGKSLGALVGLFTADCLVSEAKEAEANESESAVAGLTLDAPFVSAQFKIVLPQEDHARVKDDLAKMIALRNELVHHLLERFNLSAESGCAAACDHLDSCHEEVARHFTTLQGWAAAKEQVTSLVSSMLRSSSFEEMLSHVLDNTDFGLSFMSGVVKYLKAAEIELSEDGWTRLESAIMYVAKVNRHETPRKYGCRTWRQLVTKSEQFEVRVEKSQISGRRQVWYRSLIATARPFS